MACMQGIHLSTLPGGWKAESKSGRVAGIDPESVLSVFDPQPLLQHCFFHSQYFYSIVNISIPPLIFLFHCHCVYSTANISNPLPILLFHCQYFFLFLFQYFCSTDIYLLHCQYFYSAAIISIPLPIFLFHRQYFYSTVNISVPLSILLFQVTKNKSIYIPLPILIFHCQYF